MPRWRQDSATGKMIPIDAAAVMAERKSAAVHRGMQPFVSPVDGTLISSKRGLAEHNKRHGVVQQQEYGENCGKQHFEQAKRDRDLRLTGQTRQDRQERLNAIIPIVTRLET